VGVVTWNTASITVAALRHLLDSDQGCDLRVLVHDNSSSDGTPTAIVEALPDVDVVAGTENLGFAAGVNRLLDRSDAPWFVALNSDAWPEPGALRALVDAADRNPTAAVVVPRLERPSGELEHSTHPFPSVRVAALLALGVERLVPARAERLHLNGYWQHDRARQVDWAVGACWLMRRAAVEAVGPLDERYFMYVEDLEWCWRARRAGWGVWFEPEALVRHIGNASGESSYGAGRTRAYLRNTYRFYRREHGLLPAAAYRGCNALGAGRHWFQERVHGDRDGAAWWAEQLKAHLASARGLDGPPPAP
jgi:GT2 family glycosyltransferase